MLFLNVNVLERVNKRTSKALFLHTFFLEFERLDRHKFLGRKVLLGKRKKMKESPDPPTLFEISEKNRHWRQKILEVALLFIHILANHFQGS